MTDSNHAFLLSGTRRHRLDNGLNVLIREDHSVPIVASMIWYRVGSRFERSGITGISHFLEHMMFKGSRRYDKGEIDYVTTRNGGSNNAFTSNDYTAYYFSFASDRWEVALEIEADRMVHNRFDLDEFELERQVILEELKMDLDHPWGALRQAVGIQCFQQHPYRFPVIGLYEDLIRISREEMLEYYRRFYAPNNATLVVAGDVDGDHVLSRVEALFGGIEAQEVGEAMMPQEERMQAPQQITLDKPSHVPRLLIALKAPSVRQPEHYAVQILDSILSEGKLSRLYRRMIEEEKIASIAATDFGETYDPYLFWLRLELLPDAQPDVALGMVFEELERLGREPLTETELQRAKNQCVMDFYTGFETPLDQAVQLGLLETLDRFEYWNAYENRIRSLDAETVRQVAQRYLSPGEAVVGSLPAGAAEEQP